MKKICKISLLMILFGILFLSACSKNDKKYDKMPVIRLITDASGIEDKSFNATTWDGILSFYGDTWEKQSKCGKYYDVITCEDSTKYVSTLRSVAKENVDLIITTGFSFADSVSKVAYEYPEQKFMIIDVDWIDKPNVIEYVFAEEQGAYLVGLATALQAQEDGLENPKFGFIGGIPGSTITKFEMGYIQGIKSVYPNAEILDFYTYDWNKPTEAKNQAKKWYDEGVYAIFSAAGATGNGTIAQAKEYRVQGKNVWAVGVDSDQYEEGIYDTDKSAVLTSMLKRVDTSVNLTLTALANDTFNAGPITLDIVSNGIDYAKTNKELKSSVIDKVDSAKIQIMKGIIKVIPTYEAAYNAGVAPKNLKALDN